MHNVAVLHHIVLPLYGYLARFAAFGFGSQGHVVVVLDHLGTYETPLKVGVYDACRLGSFHAFLESPRAALLGARSQEGLQIQQTVGGLDEAAHAALLEAQVFKEHLLLFVALEFRNIGLDGGSHNKHLGILVTHGRLHSVDILVATDNRFLIHIADVEHRLGGEEHQVAGNLLLALVELDRAGALAGEKGLPVEVHHFDELLGTRVATCLPLFHLLFVTVLDGLEVFELQLQVYRVLVAHRVHRAIHMSDIVVVEAAQHMDDGVATPYVGQELVAQPLPLRGSSHQARNIHNLHRGGYHAGRALHLHQLRQSLVGNGDDAHIGLYRAEGKIRRLRFSIAQTVEKGRLAHVGQTHYTTL